MAERTPWSLSGALKGMFQKPTIDETTWDDLDVTATARGGDQRESGHRRQGREELLAVQARHGVQRIRGDGDEM